MTNKKIILIGFMCSGKTVVGSLMAKGIKKSFIDLDDEIIRYKEKTIMEIFDEEGEKAFRDLEREFAFLLQGAKDCIISCGGGLVINEETANYITKDAEVIYLKANKETILKNYRNDDVKRPLLEVENIEENIEELLKIRTPLYEKYATLTVEVDNLTVKQIAIKVLKGLGYGN